MSLISLIISLIKPTFVAKKEVPMEENQQNKLVYQSYILTAARYELSVYEKRILYCLVELAQSEVEGKGVADFVGAKVSTNLFGDKDVSLPIRYILADDDDNNYTQAKNAFRSMTRRLLEYEDDKVWSITNFIERVNLEKKRGYVNFRVAPIIWSVILDFTKGYRKFELKTAMSLRSVYAMRLYELMSGQKTPLHYTVEDLRKMLRVENKFKKVSDFEKRVLAVAKKELDEKSPYSFTYDAMVEPSRGRTGMKVVGYALYPQFIHKNVDMDLEKKSLIAKVSPSFVIPKEVMNYLISKGFSKEELGRNLSTLELFLSSSREPILEISEAWGRSIGKKNPKGYFINTIKGMTKDKLPRPSRSKLGDTFSDAEIMED